MNKKYLLNPLAVLFLPKIDAKNNYQTIVYNIGENKILKINKIGYKILKIINEKPRVSLKELLSLLKKKQSKIKTMSFLERMTEENIVFEK